MTTSLARAFPARRRDMGHHIDLGRDRVAAPDDDQVGFGHLASVDPALGADPGAPAGVGERIADRQIFARIAHRVAQPVDAVALHQPHRAGIVIGPHGLGAIALGRTGQRLGDLVERIVPGDRLEGIEARAFFADPAQRLREAFRMMLPLGVAGDLGADHTLGVGLRRSPSDPADAAPVEALDLERAGARAVMRAHAGHDVERQGSAPPWRSTQNIGTGRLGRDAVNRSPCLLRSATIGFMVIPQRQICSGSAATARLGAVRGNGS